MSLAGYSAWGLKELDSTEHTHTEFKIGSHFLIRRQYILMARDVFL